MPECCACYEECNELTSCGHCVHTNCLKKYADSIQLIKAKNGQPLLKCGLCPICKKQQPEIKPDTIEELSKNLDFCLTPQELSTAIEWYNNGHKDMVYNLYALLSITYPFYDNLDMLWCVANCYNKFISKNKMISC
jgi:hypothetical protein